MKQLILLILLTMFCGAAYAEKSPSYKAKKAFKIDHPFPAKGITKGSCPSYVIDHIKPLAYGGADSSNNMQWRTKAEAKAKDKWDRKNADFI